MKHLACLFVAVVALGCGGKKQAPDCTAAVDNAIKISSAEMKLDAAMTTKLREVSLARCQEDKWSADALACIAASKTGGDLGTCEQKKTPAQREALNKAIDTSGDAGSGSAGSAGSAGSDAGSGSAADKGSAGSGSAAAPK